MNRLISTLSPTAPRMIRGDHTHVLAQFHKLDTDTSDSVRLGVVHSICAALEIHAQLEEEIFYPALRDSGMDAPGLDKSVPEHDEMRRLIERLRSLEGQGAQQTDALNELMRAVLHHVADEETQLLPAAEKWLGPQRLSELGAQMTSRRLELARPLARELVTDMARAAPAKTALMAAGALVAASVLVSRLRRGNHAAARHY